MIETGCAMTSFNYVTVKGDTFDILALDFYNDEHCAKHIIDANPSYSNVIKFDARVRLTIPIIEQPKEATLPPWQRA